MPGDKSISHRALILGALAVGETRISGLARGRRRAQHRQIDAGAGRDQVERTGDFAWAVRGVGVAGFAQPAGPLDFGNSGTGCRLVMGAVAGCPITAVFDGDASLRSRPMRRILDPAGIDGRQGRRRGARGRPAAADPCRARAIRCRSLYRRRSPRPRSNPRCCWRAWPRRA